MKRLDLHGIKHEDVRSKVIKFVEGLIRDNESEAEVITGRSTSMQNLVGDVLKEYDLQYEIGGPLVLNNSFIRVHVDF